MGKSEGRFEVLTVLIDILVSSNVHLADKMGLMYSAYVTAPDTTPSPSSGPTFDPLLGFESREERKINVTLEEMQAAGFTADQRDYCADSLMEFFKCRRDKFPFGAMCSREKHAWDSCEHEDFVLRMKEFERERRLRERAKRIRLREEQEAM